MQISWEESHENLKPQGRGSFSRISTVEIIVFKHTVAKVVKVGSQKVEERNRKEKKRGTKQLEKSFMRTMKSEFTSKNKIQVFVRIYMQT